MESWCKVACDLDSHPKIRRAGRAGREVFLFALRRNAMPGNPTPGRVSALELEPWYLADQLQMPADEAVTGVTACVTAGLLVRDDDAFAIVGWHDEWGRRPMSNAERQAKFRDKRKQRKGNEPQTEPHVTASNGQSVTSNASNAGEERREEETKISDPRSPARAIPQAEPEASGSYDPDDPRQRGKLAEEIYRGISDDRVRIAAELGVSAHPFPAITPASLPRSFRDLRQRISEEGRDAPAVCARVREALVAQARKTNSIEWLSEKAFTEGAWITAKEWIPGWRRAGSAPRATQKSSTVFDALDELAATVGSEAS